MDHTHRAIAVVGVGAILPDALNARAFWQNILARRYSISETPPGRWSVEAYFDPDPAAPDKTYSKIGGWVRDFSFDWQRFRIPPKVAAAMDQGQQWAVTIAAEALADYGFPDRALNTENTGVILGTAMGGELHYLTNQRVIFPEFAHYLRSTPAFQALPPAAQAAMLAEFHAAMNRDLPGVSEDSMPGELPNIVAGRVANVLNLRGPNFIADAACASTFAAVAAAVEMLCEGHVDAVLTGGVDRNMGISTFVKFCKIGALSATGTRPFGAGADGFVMGEGAAAFLLKRLEDAERDGDKIYAVIRGVGASSDGKGKGITAPNPLGQVYAIERAWQHAGLDPATATLVEAHGTSTRVGDVVEIESLTKVFGGAERGRIGLGSAKSNIGHLKAGAGAAGLLKTIFALHERVLPPTLNADPSNPNVDFSQTPFYLLHEAREWERPAAFPRRAAVSAYGFGGTNFHLVLEEYVPGMLRTEPQRYAGADVPTSGASSSGGHYTAPPQVAQKPPLRGILALGAATPAALAEKLAATLARVRGGYTPPVASPDPAELRQAERLVVDFANGNDLAEKLAKAMKAANLNLPAAWKPLAAQGVFRGSGQPNGKIAFLFPGQGSQYLNMGRELAQASPAVARVFQEADAIMTPILGRPLTSYLFVESDDPAVLKQAERALMQTAITQPAMLTLDIAILTLLAEYGIQPDMVMGHSLGEYGALVAAGVMPFAEALEAAAARGAEMTKVSVDDNGWMAAVMAPLDLVEQTINAVDGYVVAANLNSYSQAVIGGASQAVEQALEAFVAKGFQAQRIPVSHAFHTKIVAPASKPLRTLLDRLQISSPRIPLVANVTGELYPTDVEQIKDILERQIASPVQWVKGLETLYREGCRIFVECGPKKALKSFVDDVLGRNPDLLSLFSNHPKTGELASFNQALCGLYAAGCVPEASPAPVVQAPVASLATPSAYPSAVDAKQVQTSPVEDTRVINEPSNGHSSNPDLTALSNLLVQAFQGGNAPQHGAQQVYDRNRPPSGSVVISGTGLGLPGAEKPVMAEDNVARILRGDQLIDLIPERFRRKMLAKHVTRVVKDDNGGGSFQTIEDSAEVIKLAGRPGSFDLTAEYGVPARLVEALDSTSQLAIAAGLDALREAGIPLVQTYKKTSRGTFLPDRWLLPEALRDETGVIFTSAFPGLDRIADEFQRYYEHEARQALLEELEALRAEVRDEQTLVALSRRIVALRDELAEQPYEFDRRFIFRILAMGHSQMAEYIGARGPNTHVNAACASTAQGIALAEDWIRSGRCRRVLVIGGDNATNDQLMEWIGAGFLATGAAATDDKVEEAALPFDRRRHGTILGMGACALLIESEDAVRERGMRAIAELLASETSNSAFHGTRLDVQHISQVVESLVGAAERRFGVDRRTMAAQTVFVSHETFTPARGGSASAEVAALRNVFGPAANEIVVANTKGLTGHPMGVGIEDVIAVKILEHGIVPPVPNYREVDPDLGSLNLSRGGRYPVRYAIHFAAGFGSQLALTLLRRIPGAAERIDSRQRYDYWLAQVAGYDRAATEVVQRVLRVQAQGAPQRMPAPSSWQPGTSPSQRAAYAPDLAVSHAPLPSAPSYSPAPPPPAYSNNGSSGNGRISPAPAPAPAPVAHAPVPVPSAPAPVAPAPVPAPAPAPVAPVNEAAPLVTHHSSLVTDPVETKVLNLVAEKTGYPLEMLDLDLDLEADLGVDTVKQAETFAAVREAFAIPRIDDLRLRDYPTMRAVIGFVRDQRPDLAAAPLITDNPPPTTDTAPLITHHSPLVTDTAPLITHHSSLVTDPVETKVLNLVAEKTGYPLEMLDLDLDLEADLGVDTVKQAETFAAVREAFAIPRIDDLRLRDYPTMRAVISFVRDQRPDLAAAPLITDNPPPTTDTAPLITHHSSLVTDTAPLITHHSSLVTDPVETKVLNLVAEKTGYPLEMLDLDLDLEADLGVDTVKQAETFAAVRESFAIPRIDDLKLRDYPTLRSVIGFVHTHRPDLRGGALETRGGEELETRGREDARTPPASSPLAASPLAASPLAASPLAASPLAASPPTTDPVETKVLDLVAEKTGYPLEMLDLDLDLEADLGVDTVKQAETFAAVRESFAIPRINDLKLRDYPTLRSVIGFVHTHRPDLGGEELETRGGEDARTPPASSPPASSPPASSPLAASPLASPPLAASPLASSSSAPRRVVVPVLRPALDLCKATGVNLESGRVLVLLDQGGVGKALVARLEKRGVDVISIETPPDDAALVALLEQQQANGPLTGIYWLAALDAEPELEELDLAQWRELNRVRVKNLFLATHTMLAGQAEDAAPFLVVATRMGGLHGYSEDGALAPLGGAVTGFAKAYKRERPAALVKAVDFEAGRKSAEPAELLIAETLSDPGVVEVGYHDGLRFSVGFSERPAADGQPGMQLNGETVYLVTGAAGGITSAIIGDLAQAGQGGHFYLLDLTPAPAADDPQIARLRQGRDVLKAALIAEAQAKGERPTPVQIERAMMGVERSEAALRAIEAVEQAGGTAHYISLDLRDGAALAAVVDDLRERHGRLDVLLHAGGIEISRVLNEKSPDEFNRVFDIKADGFFSLLRAAKGLPIGATVAFSSVAGRFGNSGQSDYSAANDLLCKLSSSMRRWRPETRAITIDWTAWGGIGMATRGSIPRIMAMAGIDMLPPEVGIPTIRRELTAGATRDEIVVGLGLGVLVAPFDPHGGLDPAKLAANLAARERPLLMVGSLRSADLYEGIVAETTLDPAQQPFLYDHQIEGTPVLPGVMGTEGFAELASLLVPGFSVARIEREELDSPVKFHRNQPRPLTLSAFIHPADNGDLIAHTALRSTFQPSVAAGQTPPPAIETVHFRAEVRLSRRAPAQPQGEVPSLNGNAQVIARDAIYQVYFHGPAYQVLAQVTLNDESAIGLMANDLPADSVPADVEQLVNPRLLELCFQTAGVWEIYQSEQMALPSAFDSLIVYRNLRAAPADTRIYAVVSHHASGNGFDARVLDDQGNVYLDLSGYRTARLPGRAKL
ncbi:type I polyketide synthase [Candidatus Viridilinea mediisalina]|uniref:Beta-ketoacyl synthase n=1 Tax=Candidatus Viridilinea mediisalina TaxID=2024553 RepID=A0A2A6RP27_9CHLR|nr:type I polyketide synthase [Candidatus Viridilinea mediisalina]PDW04854.1 beta-ketoacyl synthase [Candidatus Viridilinea mediisalina]